ncbi:MAG: DUF378 domain-containing protein [Clostridiales bacterium]|nr:DUF378 domain-containing protein [Clostridiales bacterium]
MRITALLAYFFILIGAFDLFVLGLFSFSLSGFILGMGSVAQRIFYCIVGVSGLFFLFFGAIYKPFKSLSK